ncbi:YgaP family membrane protein [Marinobacter changyiensis]|uniref:YgaP family membrane protein n=1 Tax=Marinobacter changyiensis TaxID=2604091 RepID=UPI001265635B
MVLVALVLIGPQSAPQSAWGWIGIIPLATALVGRCPAYSLFGIKTCKAKSAR